MSHDSFPKAVRVALSRLVKTLDHTDFRTKNSGIGLQPNRSESSTSNQLCEKSLEGGINDLKSVSPMKVKTSDDFLMMDVSVHKEKEPSNKIPKVTKKPFVQPGLFHSLFFYLIVHMVDLLFCLISIYMVLTASSLIFLPEDSFTELFFHKGQVLYHLFPGWSWSYGMLFLYSIFILYALTFKVMVQRTMGHYLVSRAIKNL